MLLEHPPLRKLKIFQGGGKKASHIEEGLLEGFFFFFFLHDQVSSRSVGTLCVLGSNAHWFPVVGGGQKGGRWKKRRGVRDRKEAVVVRRWRRPIKEIVGVVLFDCRVDKCRGGDDDKPRRSKNPVSDACFTPPPSHTTLSTHSGFLHPFPSN
jgi:hypothetical protein